LRLHRENQSERPYPNQHLAFALPTLKLYDSQRLALDDIYKFTKGQGYAVLICQSKTDKQVPPTVRKLLPGAGAGAGAEAAHTLN